MRKLMAAVMAICLLLSVCPALAEEEAALEAVRSAAEEGIREQLDAATGWTRRILEQAEIVSVEKGSKTVKVTVQLPTLLSGVSAKDKPADDPEGYLKKALAPYLSMEDTVTAAISATAVEKDGAWAVKWSTKPSAIFSKAKGLGTKARQSYVTAQMKQALNLYLLPQAASMPSSKPKAMPEMGSVADYAARVAEPLGLTAEQAEGRLRCLLLLMEITKLEAPEGLESAVLTVRVKNWAAMLQSAYDLAAAAMLDMAGVPEMSLEEIEAVYCAYLPEGCLSSRYTTKGQATETMTVDLVSAVEEGPQTAEALMDYFREYCAAVDDYVARLAAYGATLPYYPPVDMIDTGLISGQGAEDGSIVTFDMGEDEARHGFVCIRQNGQTVLTGFVHQGVRLMVRLEPGAYKVYCATGEEWVGESYLFGRDGFYGVFDLTVEKDSKAAVHMEDVDGNLPVEELTEEAFHLAIDQ